MLKMSGNKAELFLKMLREDDWEEGMEGNSHYEKKKINGALTPATYAMKS